jgi:protease-4
LVRGSIESSNTIFILEINGPIIQSESSINDLVGMSIISPEEVKNNLDKIMTLNPNILIVSINSPGGTVSASNELYNHFEEFKKKSNSKIYFHSSEMLASGGYWSSLAGEKIYANYGAIIGSIGVKGPDWIYFNKPKLISSGILGQTIEVKDEIKVYSTNAGKSKDLFNSFRMPTNEELNHLNIMVEKINDNFIQLVSKNRKLEKEIIKNEIGGLIFNSSQAKDHFLIDEEIAIEELVNLIIKENEFKNIRVLKSSQKKDSLFNLLFSNTIVKKINFDNYHLNKCNRIRNNLVSLLSYSSVGC